MSSQLSFQFLHTFANTAFIFPGQGSQQIGMANALAQFYPVAQEAFQEADDVLGFALSKLCVEGPEEALTDTINAQPAILTACVAILRSIESELIERGITPATCNGSAERSTERSRRSLAERLQPATTPATTPAATFVAGHSMGEYTALVATGSIQYADGLRLVRERGRLMKQAGEQNPGKMAAILGMEEAQIAALCIEATVHGGIAQVANANCPGQVVISGDKIGMEKAMAAISAAGAKKVTPLAVSIGAHSPLMQSAADALRAAIDATPIATPSLPLIANTNAQIITQPDEIRAELNAQLTGSVRWTSSMQTALAAGVTRFIEIGPGEVLSGLIKRIDRNAERLSVNDPDGVKLFVEKWMVAGG